MSEFVIELCGIADTARDNEGGSRLVNENRVDLINDCEGVTPLHLLVKREGHVVAQIIKAELIVGSIGHVAGVVLPLGCLIVLSWKDHAHC